MFCLDGTCTEFFLSCFSLLTIHHSSLCKSIIWNRFYLFTAVTHIPDNSFALFLACCIKVFKAIIVEKTMLLVSLTDETILSAIFPTIIEYISTILGDEAQLF